MLKNSKTNWEPVPSLNYLYELNSEGALRNARTKHCLALQPQGRYAPTVQGKQRLCSKKSLLWEVFGVIPKTYGKNKPITIIAQFNGKCFKLKSIAETAAFLSQKTGKLKETLRKYLHFRVAEIGGYKITYYPPKDLAAVTDTVTQWKGKRYGERGD